jgi:hypothetical protein
MNFYFLSSLPRSGNTLLGAIINQNKDIKMSANTLLTDIIYNLELLKDSEIYKNFPDEQSLQNISNNVFNNYYSHWNVKTIIDRGPWGTPDNLMCLKKVYKNPKFIILHRPLLECLASMILAEKPKDVEKRCHSLMYHHGGAGYGSGIMMHYLISNKSIIDNKLNYKIFNYDDLIKNPKHFLKKLSEYVNVDLHLKPLKQFEINGIEYQDNILGYTLHKIRTNNISKRKYSYKDVLPQSIIDCYKGLDI